jgi:tetratricopeptide (TPR) repeat protein
MQALLAPALASMAVIVMLGPAAAQSSRSWAWCVNQGSTFSVDQRINGCSSIIQSGRETRRNLSIAYYSRGLAYYDKGDDDRAIAEYIEAIRLDPKFAQAYSSRGLAYDHKGDLGHADPDYNEAIRLDPKYAQAYFNRGNAYYQKGDDDRAIADYNEAIRLTPKYAYAYNNRGTAYDHKGDADRAIADYNEAIRRDPKFAQAYSNRGLAYYQKGDFDRAIANYGEAIRLDPKYAYAYNNRGNVYYQKHDENRAIAEYSEAIRLDPKYAQAYFNRGVANLYAGRLPKALADLGQSSELNPKYAYAALWLHIVDTRNNLPSQLAEAAKQIDMTKWPGPVIRLFLDQTTPQALLATADDPNAKTKQRKVCEVNFYSAELALHRHAKDEATRLFRLAATNCPQTLTERAAAHAELRALDANP